MLRLLPAIVALGSITGVAWAGLGEDAAEESGVARNGVEHTAAVDGDSIARVEAAVDSLVAPLVGRNLVSGSILIAKSGEVLLAKGFGLADRDQGSPNTAHTPFRIASVSKAITAVAVLQLVEDGKLALDAALQSFVPGFPNGDRITVAQLLSHSSGIPSDVFMEGFRAKSLEPLTLEEEIAWARENAQPQFEPGARFDYSNTGYLLLSLIIEKASGLPYEQYLAQHVFGRAGMVSSGLDSGERILPGRARGYSRNAHGEVINAAYRHPSFGWGAGALYSTVLDLLSFDRALMDGRLLSTESRNVMWTPRSETPRGDHYGMGWFLDDLNGCESATALGATGGFTATLRHFAVEDVVVVALLNHDFMLHGELFDQIALIALGRPWRPMLDPARSSAITPLAAFAGSYVMEDGTTCRLRSAQGKLEFGEPDSGAYFRVHAMSDSEGYIEEQNARLRFRKTDEGATELFALYGILAWRGHRVPEAGPEK